MLSSVQFNSSSLVILIWIFQFSFNGNFTTNCFWVALFTNLQSNRWKIRGGHPKILERSHHWSEKSRALQATDTKKYQNMFSHDMTHYVYSTLFVFFFYSWFVCKHCKNVIYLYLQSDLPVCRMHYSLRTEVEIEGGQWELFSKSFAVWTATVQGGVNIEMLWMVWYFLLSFLGKTKKPKTLSKSWQLTSQEFKDSSAFKQQLGLNTYAWVYAN